MTTARTTALTQLDKAGMKNKSIEFDPLGGGGGGKFVVVGAFGNWPYVNVYDDQDHLVGSIDGHRLEKLMRELARCLGYEVRGGRPK